MRIISIMAMIVVVYHDTRMGMGGNSFYLPISLSYSKSIGYHQRRSYLHNIDLNQERYEEIKGGRKFLSYIMKYHS
jgi:hypothetical protein